MADNPEAEIIRDLAVALIVRIIQTVAGILSLVGLFKGHWPESVLGLLFCLVINGQIAHNKWKE